jgi:hypothetical protein
MSRKTSGFHDTHLLSSIDDVQIMSWKEVSPVLSLTHWMPLGENIEKPDEEPRVVRSQVNQGPSMHELTNVASLSAIVGDQRAHHV